ncbi:hypothetical protein D0Z00_003693 [Geotrichum galactomycetum]|uniref:Uncharacterized protein n=1 Tax=Geotrichum galactomycetum TaxID=27317 RepID=A0ACB6V0E6_9ASCO|nr:hypothetical protein D0Z00_003693 [Geotrichum candidum]
MTSDRFTRGIYAPIPTFFKTNSPPGGIDVELVQQHVLTLVRAGVKGVLTCGSYGEGPLTSREERIEIVKAIREAFDANGFQDRVILHGISDNSYLTAIQNACDARDAGADGVLATPPGYYAGQVNESFLINYYTQLADHSPIPVYLYSFPAVSSGIDLTSDLIIKLIKHPNIVGAKFTCGNVGKITRVLHADPTFRALSGYSDFLVATAALGGSGTIAGPANIIPTLLVKLYEDVERGDLVGAFKQQKELAVYENEITAMGIEGTKIILSRFYGRPAGSPSESLRAPPNNYTPEQVDNLVALGDKYFKMEQEAAGSK